MENFQKAYNKIAGLPAYEEIDAQFDLSVLEGEHVLRSVAKRIAERHEYYAGMLENIIHPDSTITDMHESQAFSDAEKENLLLLLGKLMNTYRQFTLRDLEKKEFLPFIQKTWQEWPSIKQELSPVLKALSRAWTETKQLQTKIEYLG